MPPDLDYRCGYIAIVGRPNVGKSTLLNGVLGQKLSITSRKPQTTRHRILGIKTSIDTQCVYVDTPGLHTDRSRALNRYMNQAAIGAVEDVDVVILVVDARSWTAEDEAALQIVRRSEAKCIVALNKLDQLAHRSDLLPLLEETAKRADFEQIIPISALKGDNLEQLERSVESLLPVAPAMFPGDQLTDRSTRFVASEIVREKFIEHLGQELPYRLSIEIEYFEEGEQEINIGAIVWVERKGQKGIVIGKQGRVMKSVGIEARADLQRLLETKVNLKLWAKVKEGWSDNESALASLGYD